jgi:hypothetical protein
VSVGRSSITIMRADTLTAAMDTGVATIAAATARTLQAVGAFDERGLWGTDGASSMSSWLAARYRLARATAREWVRVAHALRDLPAIAEAFAHGQLSWDQVRPLTRFADPDSDVDLCRRAQELSPGDLWVEARRHERLSARKAQDAHRRRCLAIWWDPEKPLLFLNGMFPGEQGAAVEAALCRKVEELPSDPDAVSPIEARFADALTELVTGPSSGKSEPVTVVVHADAEVLAGKEPRHGPFRSETESGQRLASETVRRLACDGRIEWVVESGVVHWADGGTTNLDNLVVLCGRHHRLIHEGGWSVRGHPGRDLRFHDPGGRALRTWQEEKLPRAG